LYVKLEWYSSSEGIFFFGENGFKFEKAGQFI
jgi:hypothetical protein